MDSNLLILGIGVSEYKTDGVARFEHYCKLCGLEYRILGDGKKWYGGDMAAGAGGGQKILEILAGIENLDNRLIVLCDTFDLIPIAGASEIIFKFNSLCSRGSVLFASETSCWPDKNLAIYYPNVNTKYKYLNSGTIMGYRDDVYNLIKNNTVQNADDDQLFFTHKFLAGEKIVLDYNCELFQTLCNVGEDVVIHKNRLYNHYCNSYPVFLHGNGPAKTLLNQFENYISVISTHLIKENTDTDISNIFLALYIDSSKKNDFELFFNYGLSFDHGDYVYFYDSNYDTDVRELIEAQGFKYVCNVRAYEFDDFKNSGCEYYFLLEQQWIITKKDILKELVSYVDDRHRIISPLLLKNPTKCFSNFWGDITGSGYYYRSKDYMDLISYKLRGLWNCPYVSGVILIHKNILNWDIVEPNKFGDRDMNLCYNLRKNTLFMYMVNLNSYGHLNKVKYLTQNADSNL